MGKTILLQEIGFNFPNISLKILLRTFFMITIYDYHNFFKTKFKIKGFLLVRLFTI